MSSPMERLSAWLNANEDNIIVLMGMRNSDQIQKLLGFDQHLSEIAFLYKLQNDKRERLRREDEKLQREDKLREMEQEMEKLKLRLESQSEELKIQDLIQKFSKFTFDDLNLRG